MAAPIKFRKSAIEFGKSQKNATLRYSTNVDFGVPLRDAEAFVQGVDLRFISYAGTDEHWAVHRVYHHITDVDIVGGDNDRVRVDAEINLSNLDDHPHTGKLWVVVIGVVKDRADK